MVKRDGRKDLFKKSDRYVHSMYGLYPQGVTRCAENNPPNPPNDQASFEIEKKLNYFMCLMMLLSGAVYKGMPL